MFLHHSILESRKKPRNIKIGGLIRKLLTQFQITPTTFAHLLSVDPQSVGRWTRGDNVPRTSIIPNLRTLSSKLRGEQVVALNPQEALTAEDLAYLVEMQKSLGKPLLLLELPHIIRIWREHQKLP